MAKIERFEDIRSWQLAREMVCSIYRLTQQENFFKDYSLRDQLRRAAISVMSNIAEGFERYSNKEFIQFLVIAKGSAAEMRSHLYAARDLSYVSEDDFLKMKSDCESLSGHISKFISYLKQNLKVAKHEV